MFFSFEPRKKAPKSATSPFLKQSTHILEISLGAASADDLDWKWLNVQAVSKAAPLKGPTSPLSLPHTHLKGPQPIENQQQARSTAQNRRFFFVFVDTAYQLQNQWACTSLTPCMRHSIRVKPRKCCERFHIMSKKWKSTAAARSHFSEHKNKACHSIMESNRNCCSRGTLVRFSLPS